MESFFEIVNNILAIWGIIGAFIITVRYIWHIFMRESFVSDDIKVFCGDESAMEGRFPGPFIWYKYPTTPDNCLDITFFYAERTIIKNFRIKEVSYNGRRIKTRKTLFSQKNITPDHCIKVIYDRPEGPPEIIAEWTDKYFRKSYYEFTYNGYNGVQSRNSIVSRETFLSILARIFYY